MIMTKVNDLLLNILHGNYNFCCLCFKTITENPIHFDDEVILDEHLSEVGDNVGEILTNVFGNDIWISEFKNVCKECASLAIHSYRFIQDTKQNIQYLNNAVEHFSSCFDNTIYKLGECKSIFLAFDPNLTASNQYYDMTGFVQSKEEALHRYLSITGVKQNKNLYNINKEDKHRKITQHKIQDRCKIPVTDMLHKNDLNSLACKDCLKEFTTLNKLRSHYIRIHAPKQFKCSECPRSFGSMRLLETHKFETHVSLVCSECGKTFRHRHTLKMHEQTHYLKFVCQDCGRVYKNRNTLKKHIENNICQLERRHSPADAKFTCDYCQKKYTQKMSLRVHIQYEHGNKKYLECKWCNKKFSCQSRLKAHSVKHTKERNFSCVLCGGKFVTKESLLYHTRIHTGERPYKCPHCDGRFLSASRRTAHVKTHHMNKSFECDICNANFNSYQHLSRHRKTHVVAHDKLNAAGRKKVSYFKIDMERECLDSVKPQYVYQISEDGQINDEVHLEVSEADHDYVIEVVENIHQ